MLIEISGMQKAGKSTLINGLKYDFYLYKFPMGTVCKTFGVKPTWELQIAKDISTMELYYQLLQDSSFVEIPIISDRGPLSTIFYSLLFHRTSDEAIDTFVKYLSKFDFWVPIWVEAINQPELKREKTDGFDKLQDGLDPNEVKLAKQKMIGILDKYRIKPTIIYNDFQIPVEKNIELFQSKIKEIIGE